MSQTLDQRRAKHAWGAVQEALKIKDPDAKKKFGGQAKKLPMRIMASGLGQALAFLRAKGYAPLLLQALGDWVLDKRQNPASQKPRPTDSELLNQVVQGTSETLRHFTDEALAYLQWFNRFAEAEGLADDEE